MTARKPTPEQIAETVVSLIGREGTASADGATVTVYANNGAAPDEPFEVYPFVATFQEVTE